MRSSAVVAESQTPKLELHTLRGYVLLILVKYSLHCNNLASASAVPGRNIAPGKHYSRASDIPFGQFGMGSKGDMESGSLYHHENSLYES